jgi:hypothetical protein
MKKLQKDLLALIEKDNSAHAASDWALEATPNPFTNAKFMARIDAVLDLAKIDAIVNHETITYHSKQSRCWKCEG